MNTPYASQGNMVSSVSSRDLQGVPNQSMQAPYSKHHMGQWGTGYLGGNYIPSLTIPLEIHITVSYTKATTIPCNLCIIFRITWWEDCKDPQVICHYLGPIWGHYRLCLSWQHLMSLNCTNIQMNPSNITYSGCQSHIKCRQTSLCSKGSKGRIRVPISPPVIFGVFLTWQWMIVSSYVFFPAPLMET